MKQYAFKTTWPLISKLCGVDCLFKVSGGLGNQMFQYAFALSYRRRFRKNIAIDPGMCVGHNGWEIDKVFCVENRLRVPNPHICRIISGWARRAGLVLDEGQSVAFNPSLVVKAHLGIIYGFFPSYKYFESDAALIRRNFSFRNSVDADHWLLTEICSTPSVAVHVRRGDYLESHNVCFFSGICTDGYYQKAIAMMTDWQPDARFFVFSNDPKWCKKTFHSEQFRVIDIHSGKNSWMDLYYMSLCRHSIIANSSFSWWGMWLGEQKGRLCIGPDRLANPGLVETRIEDFLPTYVTRISPLGEVVHRGFGPLDP